MAGERTRPSDAFPFLGAPEKAGDADFMAALAAAGLIDEQEVEREASDSEGAAQQPPPREEAGLSDGERP